MRTIIITTILLGCIARGGFKLRKKTIQQLYLHVGFFYRLHTIMLTLPHFSAQNHHVRAYMVHQQQDLLQNHDICSHWLRTGLELAPILQDTIPNVYMLSQTLFHYT